MGEMEYNEVMDQLKQLSNPANVEGMARYGINPHNTYGVKVAELRGMAKRLGKDHLLAGRLWASSIHEARILASLIDVPSLVTEEQMENWAADFDSWDVCDLCCNNLLWRTSFARDKAIQWSERKEGFVKRAGFVLMATLAVHDKAAPDDVFARFLSIIEREAGDGRNYVRKAVNWALRQVGKRSLELNRQAIEVAEKIRQDGSKSGRWIASDALRELCSEKVRIRLTGARHNLPQGKASFTTRPASEASGENKVSTVSD
jgi:3-methyladenine DNA glycosylase AlkD